MSAKPVRIHEIQGDGPRSTIAGQMVSARGVVTGTTKRGYFLQDPEGGPADRSHAIFVYSPKLKPPVGILVEVRGKVTEFVRDPLDRPTTQLHAKHMRVVSENVRAPQPVWLDAELLDASNEELARRLNALEAMLVGVEAGAVFTAPSNPFGDYVVAPRDITATWTGHGGVLVDPSRPERWLPSFRILDYRHAPVVNVGSELRAPVVGPLNYRVGAHQIAALGGVRVRSVEIHDRTTALKPMAESLRILTLNGFNLDPKVEDPRKVKDPQLDVDDDVGDGRYRRLGGVIARDAGAPEIVALQEMQDDDGAELSDVVYARENYELLIRCVENAGGPSYAWCDVPPHRDADGGQPGGNIRNGFLYDPARVDLVEGSLERVGDDDPVFEGSRKPLAARFRHRPSGHELAVVNVHLASKRHQHPIFALDRPGFDPRAEIRVAQARRIRAYVDALARESIDWYVTGDFNDFEFSETLRELVRDDAVNLTETLDRAERYDYNHRGQCQALMHGVVSRDHAKACPMDYEILHGNELTGAQPGRLGDKPTDHAYVLARIGVR